MEAVSRAVAVKFLGERGATAVEYALLVVLTAVAIVTAGYLVGLNLSSTFYGVANSVATPGPPQPPDPGGGPLGGPYENCDAARAAGVAPMHIGDPGYSPDLDPDGDGVACE